MFQVEVFWVVIPCSVVVHTEKTKCMVQIEDFWVVTPCIVVVNNEKPSVSFKFRSPGL
jgi:hypothetical protein